MHAAADAAPAAAVRATSLRHWNQDKKVPPKPSGKSKQKPRVSMYCSEVLIWRQANYNIGSTTVRKADIFGFREDSNQSVFGTEEF